MLFLEWQIVRDHELSLPIEFSYLLHSLSTKTSHHIFPEIISFLLIARTYEGWTSVFDCSNLVYSNKVATRALDFRKSLREWWDFIHSQPRLEWLTKYAKVMRNLRCTLINYMLFKLIYCKNSISLSLFRSLKTHFQWHGNRIIETENWKFHISETIFKKSD